jgi:hypothetical protein
LLLLHFGISRNNRVKNGPMVKGAYVTVVCTVVVAGGNKQSRARFFDRLINNNQQVIYIKHHYTWLLAGQRDS